MYNNTPGAPPPQGYPPQAPGGYSPADYGLQHQHSYSQGPPPQPQAYGAPPVYHGSAHGRPPPAGPPPPPPQVHAPAPAATAYPVMDTYTIAQFMSSTQPTGGSAPFEVDKSRPAMLQVNFGCQGTAGGPVRQIFIKKGSMVGYRGDIKFERESVLEHGMMHALKKAVTSEGATLVKATSSGTAQLYVADMSKMVTVLQLQGESISVNGDDLLAFEPSLEHKIVMMRKLSAMVSGGLFNVKLTGRGCVAILSHGKPLTLPIRQGQPVVFTDPQATVAWSGHLNPDFNSDVQFKTLLGRSSGESFQMKFDPRKGEGFVVIQPYEEIPAPSGGGGTSFSLGL